MSRRIVALVLTVLVVGVLPAMLATAQQDRGASSQTRFEGWNRIDEWPGPELDGVDEIIDYLNEHIDPPAWEAIAYYDGEGWLQTFKEAPLPAFNTLDESRPRRGVLDLR